MVCGGTHRRYICLFALLLHIVLAVRTTVHYVPGARTVRVQTGRVQYEYRTRG
jgi:hypothetical protein